MGIKVIAEGIERKEELESVLDTRIELLQGYYLHRPSSVLCEGIVTGADAGKD